MQAWISVCETDKTHESLLKQNRESLENALSTESGLLTKIRRRAQLIYAGRYAGIKAKFDAKMGDPESSEGIFNCASIVAQALKEERDRMRISDGGIAVFDDDSVREILTQVTATNE